MKTMVQTVLALVLLASSAFASKWTPTGGTTQNPAPAGSYVGSVSREADGDKVTWKITTEKGVLEVRKGKDDLSAEEQTALDTAAKQNDKNNTVVIDTYGNVTSVSTG